MGMMDVSRRRRRMGSAVTPDYAAEVQTLLSGTAGYALDFSDTSVLWQDDMKASPVTTGAAVITAALQGGYWPVVAVLTAQAGLLAVGVWRRR